MAGSGEVRSRLIGDNGPATGGDLSTGTRTILSTMPEVREASLRVAKSAQRLLSIFTVDLEPLVYGEEPHHIAEAIFKGLGRALDAATQIEPRAADLLPSTKGSL